MKRLIGLVALLAAATQATATDLAKVPRTIAKEPAYETKNPRYCLLVFGENASPRVWLVLDGETLYVDRKGTGDLTAKEAKLSLPKFEGGEGGGIDVGRRQIMGGA